VQHITITDVATGAVTKVPGNSVAAIATAVDGRNLIGLFSVTLPRRDKYNTRDLMVRFSLMGFAVVPTGPVAFKASRGRQQ
jgi:hypothetical protein